MDAEQYSSNYQNLSDLLIKSAHVFKKMSWMNLDVFILIAFITNNQV
jgi:hypothetical protein